MYEPLDTGLETLFVEGLVSNYNVDVLMFTPEKVVVERIASLQHQFRASVSFKLTAGVDVNALFNAQVQNSGVVFLDGAPQRVMLKNVHSTGALHVQVHAPGTWLPLPLLNAALLFAAAPARPRRLRARPAVRAAGHLYCSTRRCLRTRTARCCQGP